MKTGTAVRTQVQSKKKVASTSTTRPQQAVSARIIETASRIRELIHGVEKKNLQALYEVAQLVRERQQDAKYGDTAVEMLARELKDLGLSAKTLRNYALVAGAFTPAEFKKTVAMKGGTAKKPFQLSWSHFVLLAGVDGRTRRKVLRLARERCLNIEECRALLAGDVPAEVDAGDAQPRDPGRDVRTLTAEIGQLVEREADLSSYLSRWDATGELSEVEEEDLKRLRAELEGLASFAQRQVLRCQQVLAKAQAAPTGTEPNPV